jgi:hypothetical protein
VHAPSTPEAFTPTDDPVAAAPSSIVAQADPNPRLARFASELERFQTHFGANATATPAPKLNRAKRRAQAYQARKQAKPGWGPPLQPPN